MSLLLQRTCGTDLKQSHPRLTIIAALARNGVIGRANRMPWHIPEDLKRFKALTLGHPVIMGRKTFESILETLGKPLPGRENIVVTRSRDYTPPGCRVVHSIEDAIAAAAGAEEVFVIGGGEIYALALPFADCLQLTEVHAETAGDAYFPQFERGAWKEISRQARKMNGPIRLRYDFVTYERRAR
jgi:dihydrofolate reductase